MNDAAGTLRKAVVERALTGAGTTTPADRRAAFDNRDVPEAARGLIDKVTKNAWKVTDEDVAKAKQAGLSDDQVFELSVAAALGQSTRQLDAALALLDAAKEPSK
jgi:alkylhydroperoxidase family enzyme